MTAADDIDRDHNRHTLLEEIDAHQQAGRNIPCLSTDTYATAAWTADEDDEQRVAAAACRSQPCPALKACSVYGLTHPREHGAYGGMTEQQRRRTARDTERTAP